ncbi:hypothetical protein JZ084_27755, partial [Klebsiella pneumoniae]|nr:hypothetical protein [Klebsiella pneumoniae]
MDILSTIFQQRSRRIGLMIPDVVVSERHSDALEVTEHPVERPVVVKFFWTRRSDGRVMHRRATGRQG